MAKQELICGKNLCIEERRFYFIFLNHLDAILFFFFWQALVRLQAAALAALVSYQSTKGKSATKCVFTSLNGFESYLNSHLKSEHDIEMVLEMMCLLLQQIE